MPNINKKAFVRGLNIAVLTLGLFIFGLNVPKISTAIILLISLFSVVKGGLLKRLNLGFLTRSALLLLFSITYYLTIYIYTFIDFQDLIRNILLIICLYCAGYSIRSSEVPGGLYGLVWVLLSIVAGFVVFSFLSVKLANPTISTLLVMGRETPSFWTGSDPINGPVLGVFASLGICLAPVILFGRERNSKKPSFEFVSLVISFLVIIGGYANILLQNRLPYLALILSFFFSGFIYFYKRKEFLWDKITTRFLITLIFGVFAFIFFYKVNDFLFDIGLIRFREMGFRTGRYESWEFMIKSLFTYPLGGREAYIGCHRYVHNLWLDVAYSAGILPLILLLLFHISHLKSIVMLIRSRLPIIIRICIATVNVSILVSFVVEPILDASVAYFSATCFLLGFVRRLSLDVERYF